MIGRTLGNYRVVEQIGIGGMATVFKAYDPSTDRNVAIKVLPHQFSADPTFRERFEREARAIAKLEHLHILPIFGYGEDNGTVYMVMRYLEAGTLTDRIKQGPMALPEAARLLTQIAEALDYAHSFNILHRDVKPSNVLLDAQGNAFLTDFGIAKMIESADDLTGTGILGTPAYMSPEQCLGSKTLTPATDQYSLGIVLYEMITGHTPFRAETPIALIHMQLNEPLPMPRTIRTDLPDAAERTILKALAKETTDRYPSCSDFAAAFSQTVQNAAQTPPDSGATMLSSAPSTPTYTSPDDGSTVLVQGQPTAADGMPRWVWAAGGVVALLLLATLGFFLFRPASTPSASSTTSETAQQTQADNQPTQETADVAQPTPNSEAVATPAPTSTVSPTPDSDQAEADNDPAAAAAESEPTTQVDTAQPVVDPEVIPLDEVEITPAEAFEMAGLLWPNQIIEPCSWHGKGDGLCLFTWEMETEPIQILAGANLDFIEAPSFSPDGTQFAFSAAPLDSEDSYAEANLFIAGIDGANLTEISLPGSQLAPDWSPNGEWLAFSHDDRLAIMRPEGDDLQMIVDIEAEQCVQWPQWSPDSETIVISVQEVCDNRLPITRHIWLVAVADQTVTPLVTTVHNNGDCANLVTTFMSSGQQVAYIDGECEALALNVDGSGQPTSLDDFPWDWMSNVFPAWQEQQFVELCEYLDTGGPGACIYSFVRNLDRILEDAALDLATLDGPFGWSPDGQQLVFSAAAPDAELNSLYIVGADDTGLTQLPLPEYAAAPVWSPDGEWLAFLYDTGQLAIVRPDGSDFRVVYDEPGCVSRPAWSPDSQWLLASIQVEPANCDYVYPHTRQLWLLAPGSDEAVSITEITYPRECDDDAGRVAFNRSGEYIAYYAADCSPVIVQRAAPDQTTPLSDFPWWWENSTYPQWGSTAK